MSKHLHTDKVLSDLESTIEHLKLIKQLIESEQTCVNVLNQLSGIFVRLNLIKSTILTDHIRSCISGDKLNDPTKLQIEIEQILKAALAPPPTGSFH